MKNILIQADNLICAFDTYIQLERLGYNVWGICRNRAEVLANIDLLKPDLIIVQPKINEESICIQFAKDLKSRYNIPSILWGDVPRILLGKPHGY